MRLNVETAGDDAQEIWVMSEEFFPYEDNGVSYNESEGKEPVSEPYPLCGMGLPDPAGASGLGNGAGKTPQSG